VKSRYFFRPIFSQLKDIISTSNSNFKLFLNFFQLCDQRRCMFLCMKKSNLWNLILTASLIFWGYFWIFTLLMVLEQGNVLGTDRLGWKTHNATPAGCCQIWCCPTPHVHNNLLSHLLLFLFTFMIFDLNLICCRAFFPDSPSIIF